MAAWRSFMSRNLISIVMIPFMIGAHYTWFTLQKDDRLVTAQERKKLPFASLLFDKKPFSLETVASDWAEIRREFTNQDHPHYSADDFAFNFW